jgi:hypothetical protein
MRAVAARLAIALLVPFLVAAADPAGDVAGCRGGPVATPAPDLVRADGAIVELGTSARWRLTFSSPLRIPDPVGHPFRVDVAIFDPTVPPESFAYYHRINRIVRVDATVDHRTEIYLLPERAANEFLPPTIDGRTLTIQVPGRILTEDRDLTGTSPGLRELRWTVIVRDQSSCDFLGNGSAIERLIPQPSPSPEPRVHEPGRISRPLAPWIATLAGLAVAGLAIGYVARRAR